MNIVVIFDVSKNENDVREALKKNGFHSRWNASNDTYNLPKYCMWKPNTTLIDAKAEFIKIVSELGLDIIIQRLLVLAASPWEGIKGEEILV